MSLLEFASKLPNLTWEIRTNKTKLSLAQKVEYYSYGAFTKQKLKQTGINMRQNKNKELEL